jgi:hypothetical protein
MGNGEEGVRKGGTVKKNLEIHSFSLLFSLLCVPVLVLPCSAMYRNRSQIACVHIDGNRGGGHLPVVDRLEE